MENLSDGKGDSNPHRSPTITVLFGPNKATLDETLQVDGVSTTISFGEQEQEG